MDVAICFENGFVGIPYAIGHDSSERHEFVNLRDNPQAIDSLPEPNQWPELREFLMTANRQNSVFFTLGSECAGNSGTFQGGMSYKVTSYVQLAFVDHDVAQAEDSYLVLAGRFFKFNSNRVKSEPLVVEFAMEHFVIEQNPFAHCISIWLHGFGADERSARKTWADGLKAIGAFLEQESNEPIWKQHLAWRTLRKA